MSKSLSLGIVIGASLGSGFAAATKGAYASLDKIGEATARLSQTRLDVKEFRRLSQSAGENRARLDELAGSLRRAGIDVRDLDRHSRSLNTTLFHLKKQSDIRGQIETNRQALAEARGSLIGVLGTAYAARRLINAQGDILKAQGEIASLGISEEGIRAITQAGQAFSNAWAGTTTEAFVRASYDIKSGISSLGDEAVGEFTGIAALTAAATKSTPAEMTNLFAKGFGIYRDQFDAFGARVVEGWEQLSREEQDIEFGKYFSAGISSAVQAFRTDGAQMSQALSTLGASATTAGMAFSEQLSVLGALQRTMSGSEAATQFKSFLANASKAGDALGLDFIDEQTGMLRTVPEILDQISDHYGGVIDQFAKDELRAAFGDRTAMAMVDVLLGQQEELRKGASEIERSLSGGLQTTEEMARAIQRGRGFELLTQQIGNLSAAIGKTLYPSAELMAGAIGKVVVGIQWLSDRFPRLTGLSVGLVAGFVGLLAASKALTVATLWLRGGWLGLQASFHATMAALPRVSLAMAWFGRTVRLTTLRLAALTLAQKAWAVGSAIVTAATTAISAGFRAMTLAIMSNPIGLVIAGIAVGAALIIKYWEPIKSFFSGIWEHIRAAALPLMGIFKRAFEWSPLGLVIGGWEPIKAFFSNFWQWLKDLFSKGVGFLAKVWEMSPLGLALKAGRKIAGLVGGIMNRGAKDAGPDLAGETAGPDLAPAAAMAPVYADEVHGAPPAPAYVRESAGSVRDVDIDARVNAPITIYAAPGMNAEDIAAEVQRALCDREAQAAARARGALYD